MKRKIKDELFAHNLYINQVSDLLLWHFDDHKQAAEYFGVTPQTVKNWLKKGNWPLSVVRLLLIMHRGYLPISPQWRGFKIRGDKLYTPAGRELSAYDLMELDIRMSLKTTSNVVQFRRKKKKRYRLKSKQGLRKPC
ncbi:DUF3653 domain-containing protein [Vibrio europaeus]|uniref:DUF3653 domain-containing protein n=1 Tax=Vibrio oreintalis group TaxID=1891919 RepID=UPI001EFCDC70|nr:MULTISPECIES: DUF3653 domain-containing protein [Vibrio oreintalis group]MCG9576411.1 DUF3653 domain-containing protein [Vibrio tubiashii]MDC5840181.1 DUF3653 domain-containing protein [Vibrio europaeus]MDC5840200.1 DUF3653 domain-containing protein [Vibrio europaeus]MDC5842439.1 DUF3653 domain-containing protein [Vibrio europaeus]